MIYNDEKSTGDPESPSGYTVTKLDCDCQIIDSLDVSLTDEEEYNKVARLFCDSSKWQKPVKNKSDVDMEVVDVIYKIEQHFSYEQSRSTLFFIEDGNNAYCFDASIDDEINFEDLYKCEYDVFLDMKNIFVS